MYTFISVRAIESGNTQNLL